jgi:hypothetical protein
MRSKSSSARAAPATALTLSNSFAVLDFAPLCPSFLRRVGSQAVVLIFAQFGFAAVIWDPV